MLKGQIIKSLAGIYYVESDHTVYQCKARGKFRKEQFKPLVGDFCEFQVENETEGYIFKIEKRKNELIRPAIANIDQALLVFSIKEPDMNFILLDRFLALIEHHQIKPIICVSKLDLLSYEQAKEMMKPYTSVGYEVYYVSSKEQSGIENIKKIFENKTTVITGQSGVGKSSLLNALDIHLNLDTNEISKALGRGKHTTRHVELFKIYNGYIADTPGFSSLEINMEPKELAISYHDFEELSVDCKFRGCLHEHEPYCAVKQAVEDGIISKERYEHYLMFLKEVKELKERKYG